MHVPMPRRVWIVLFAGFLGACAALGPSSQVERLVVFGDSNVDNGNLFRLTGEKVPAPPDWRGRNSNGPNVVEYVAKTLGARIDNYAVSGATSGAVNIVGRLVPAYKSVEMTGVRVQVDEFIKKDGGKLGTKDVVILWAGSNDIFGIQRSDRAALERAIASAAANTGAEIERVAKLGARRIIVANRTPREALETDNDLNGQDLNKAIASVIAESAKRTGADVRLFDAYGLIADMMRSPARHGFTQVNALCKSTPACASESWEAGLRTANGYVNWDAAHKTTRVHELMAEKLVALLRQN